MLWYPSHYEGFETADNVVYTGATANQHILPLIDHLVRHHGKRAYCVGSNYIWPWENNRVLREEIVARGGAVLGERYFAIGDRDFGQLVTSIIAARPDFVFMTLIGTSAYAFCREFREACESLGIDQAATMPIASCSLAEPELEAIGPGAVDGHLSSSVYFSTVDTPENRRFVAAYEARFPDGPTPSADAEAAYICTWLLAKTLADTNTCANTKTFAAANETDLVAIKAAAARQRFARAAGRGLARRRDLPRLAHAAHRPFQFTSALRRDRAGTRAGASGPLSRALGATLRDRQPPAPEGGDMSDIRLVQNFRGYRALIVAAPTTATDTLTATLSRLGVTPEHHADPAAQVLAGSLDPDRDMVFLDGDSDEPPGAQAAGSGRMPPVPVIGLVGVAAPTRLKSLLRQGVTAILHKPVQGSAVFSALFVGVNEFRRRRHVECLMDRQERRVRARRAVIKAVVRLMHDRNCNDDEAYRWLRRESMASRVSLEDICDRIVAQAPSRDPSIDQDQHEAERG